MATVKNFGLAGVADSVQFGKGGGYIVENAGNFSVTSDGVALSQLSVATTPTGANHATSKQYVDSVVTGLDVKASVRVATTSSSELTGFTYVPASDIEGPNNDVCWTGTGSATFDGLVLADNDRVLIKNATDQRGNGIFVFDAGAGFYRAEDSDNSPGNEVSGGMFTFVEQGTVNGNYGFVLSSPSGAADLGTNSLVFSQFSGAGSIIAGNGLVQTGNIFDVNPDGVTTHITGDTIAVKSSATTGQVLLSAGSGSATWGAVDLDNASSHTGTLSLVNGGTNTDTSGYATDSLMTMVSGTGVAELAKGANSTVLKVNGSGVLGYAKVDLAADVSGVLPVANGGSGTNSLTDGAILIGAGTAAVEFVPGVADTDMVLHSGGTGVNPTFGYVTKLHDALTSADVGLQVLAATTTTVDVTTAAGGVTLAASAGNFTITPGSGNKVILDGYSYPTNPASDDFEGAFVNLIAKDGSALQLSFPTWVTDDINTGFQSWAAAGPFYSMNDGTGQFSLLVGGTGYVRSHKVTWAGSQDVSLTQYQTNYVYVDSTGTIGFATAATSSLYEDNIVLFEAYWDGAESLIVRENHPYNFDTQVAGYLHRVVGTIISGSGDLIGADVTAYTVPGPGAHRINVSTGGFVEDHGLRDAISSSTTGATWQFWHTDSSGRWVRNGAPGLSFTARYDNAGTIANTADYAVYTLYVTKSDLNSTDTVFVAIFDDQSYPNVGAANTAINDGTVRGQTGEIFDVELTRLGYAIVSGAGTAGSTADDVIQSVIISKEVLGSQILSGGGGGTAASVSANVAAFNNVLSGSHTTVQLALDAIDDHTIDDHNGVNTAGKVDNDVLTWNSTTSEWQSQDPLTELGILSYGTITADTGSASATQANQTLQFVGGTGITTVVADGSPDAVTISLNVTELTTDAIALSDELPFYDVSGSDHNKSTFQSMIENLDIVTTPSITNGFLVKTANDTYVGRSVVASAANNRLGVDVVNGNGVAGDPTVGLNVTGLTALTGAASIAATDELFIYDLSVTTNKKVTVADLFNPANNPSFDNTRIADADATTFVDTDATAETVTVQANGDKVADFVNTGGTGTSNFVFEVGTVGEVEIEAVGVPANIDIRLSPKGTGQVLLGTPGTDATISSSDGTAGENLNVLAGDGTAGAGGDLTLAGGNATGGAGGDVFINAGDTTDSNAGGNIVLNPGNSGSGTDGNVLINDGNGNEVMQFLGVASAVNYFIATNAATGSPAKLEAAGTDTNIDILLTPKGTGDVVVPAGYAPGTALSLVTKGYVDTAISSGAVSSAHSSKVFLPGNTIGTADSNQLLPTDARVVKVVVRVTTPYNAGVTLTVGITGQTDRFASASEIDLQTAGVYIIDLFDTPVSSQDIFYTLAGGTGGVGVSEVYVEYRNA